MTKISTAARRITRAANAADPGDTLHFDAEGNVLLSDTMPGYLFSIEVNDQPKTQAKAQELLDQILSEGGQDDVEEADEPADEPTDVIPVQDHLVRIAVLSMISKEADRLMKAEKATLDSLGEIEAGQTVQVVRDGRSLGAVSRAHRNVEEVIDVADADALLSWVRDNAPEALVESVADPSDPEVVALVKKHLPGKITDSVAPYFTEEGSLAAIIDGGEVPDGVRVREKATGGNLRVAPLKPAETANILETLGGATIARLLES